MAHRQGFYVQHSSAGHIWSQPVHPNGHHFGSCPVSAPESLSTPAHPIGVFAAERPDFDELIEEERGSGELARAR